MPQLSREERRKEARQRASTPLDDMDGFRESYHKTVTGRVGVMCLSEIHDDVLMWAHYADAHRGVCLVFDPADPFFATAQPVHYQTERPHVNPLVHSREQMLDAAMFTKSEHWSYEREWRILHYKRGSGVCTVPAAALKQVILGAAISDDDEVKVRQWIAEATSTVTLSRATLSPTKFEVKISAVWGRDE